MNKKLFYNKTAKGLVSLITIILLLSSILATTIYYNNMITANVVQESSVSNLQTPPIKEISDLNELSQLNEGWYEIRNGYVFYLESFDSYVPLYIKVKNPQSLNGLLVVDEDGNIEFSENTAELADKIHKKTISEENIITGEVTGLEKISGYSTREVQVKIHPVPSEYNSIIDDAENRYELPRGLLKAVINTESGFDPSAKSNKGAIGLGQLMHDTALQYGQENYYLTQDNLKGDNKDARFNPELNIEISARYLKGLLSKHNQNIPLTLSEYNCCFGNEIARNSETQEYISRVMFGQRYYESQQNPTNTKSYSFLQPDIITNEYANRALGTGTNINLGSERVDPYKEILATTGLTKKYYVNLGGTNIELGDFSSKEYATAEADRRFGIREVIEESKVTIVGNKYYVYLKNGRVIELNAADRNEASEKGERIAAALRTQLDRTEPQKFLVTDKFGHAFSIEASTDRIAMEIVRSLGLVPISASPISPGTTISTREFLVKTDKDTYPIQAVNEVEAKKQGEEIARLRGETFQSIEPKYTFEEFKAQNPRLDVNTLTRIYNEIYGVSPAKKEEEILQPVEIFGKNRESLGWYFNGQQYKTKEEADVVLNKVVTEKYAKAELKGKTLSGEVTPESQLLAKDPKGVYKFVATIDKNGKVTGGKWEDVGASYQRQRTIGKDADAIALTETIDVKTGKPTEIKLSKDGKTVTVDQDTERQIEITGGKGVNFITSSETNKEQIIEFTDPKTGLFVRKHFSADYTLSKGTIKEESFRIVYFDENGKELSKERLAALQKEGKLPQPKLELRGEKEVKDNKLQSFTSYSYRTESRDGKNIRVAEGIKINAQTGKVEGFVYSEREGSGNERRLILDKDGKIINRVVVYSDGKEGTDATNAELDSRAKKAESQYNSRQFFASVERVFTEFRGLGYYATLFWDDDYLLKWRDDVDRAFASAYLGTEYWTSAICSNRLHGEQEGVAFAETPQGLAQVGAHIEATRTQPIKNEKGEESYIYKITFNVRNGDYEKDLRAPENMSVNALIIGAEPLSAQVATKKAVVIFKKDIDVGRGTSFGKMGRSAIVRESKILYTDVCLTFDKIPIKWKLEKKEDNRWVLCNKIQESSVEPTKIRETAPASGAQGDLNDF